jgi:uncharacterized membrane protein
MELLLIAALGGAVVIVWRRANQHRDEMRELRKQLDLAQERLRTVEAAMRLLVQATVAPRAEPAPAPLARPAPAPPPPPTAAPRPAPVGAAPPQPPAPPRPPFAPSSGPPRSPREPVVAAPHNRLVGWFLQGNPVAKVGVILLFFGLAFLLRFANEHGLMPIEFRLTGAAITSVALLVVGWRLRVHRPVYALTLQGGSIGALYVTCFAAFRVYSLLPHALVFALLVVICAACVTLAVLQRAQSLAVLASLGGYLAPILLSTGTSDHIALFTYYALLSVGILAVSLYRTWRPLNLIGFAFSFGVGTLWGVDRYEPSLYPACQLFLALNVVIYGVLAVLTSLRRTDANSDAFVDGTLAFGTPLVAFGLQSGLTKHWEYGPAFSALAYAALYLPLAWFTLTRWRERARRATAAFLALGAGFVTLAIPLALSAKWTSMAWALEGLGVLWVGRSQRQTRMILSGTALLVLAAISASAAWSDGVDTPTFLMITSTLSIVWMGGAWLWRDLDAVSDGRLVSRALLGGGVLVWLWLSVDGSERIVDDDGRAALLAVLWMSATAIAWAAIGRRVAWSALEICAVVLWPFACVALYAQLAAAHHPMGSGWWSLGWIAAIATEWHLLRLARSMPERKILPVLHAAVGWLLFAGVIAEALWQLEHRGWGTNEGRATALLALAASFLFGVWRLARGNHWAPVTFPRTYWIAWPLPALMLGCGLLISANLLDGRLASLPYVPLFNPLEQAAAFALLMGVIWVRRSATMVPEISTPAKLVLLGLATWWANGLFVRTLASVGGISWTPDALWQSALVQTSVALAWTVAALVMMALAARRGLRSVWFAGAVALGAVILKLFLVDSARTSGIARAVAFIGVALLILLIGYLAPLPPRAAREESPAS